MRLTTALFAVLATFALASCSDQDSTSTYVDTPNAGEPYSVSPAEGPEEESTAQPTSEPILEPTLEATVEPTVDPTAKPTMGSTRVPSDETTIVNNPVGKTTIGDTPAAAVTGCVTLANDGYSYSFNIDVRDGETRYRVRMPHQEAWDDWSSWQDENSMSSKAGFSFGKDLAPDALIRAQIKTKGGERTDHSVPMADVASCPQG